MCAITTATPLGLKPLYATKLIRRLIGSSQPALIEASDGSLYVVKTFGNRVHTNLLANEFLGGSLIAAVGLPTAMSRAIELSGSFLEKYDISSKYPPYIHRPVAGLHFASMLVSPPVDTHIVFEFLARCQVDFVANRSDFLGMYLLDFCLMQRDPRQAMFVKEKGSPASRATFIDHGHMFGGSNWDLDSHLRSPCHMVIPLYRGLLNKRSVNSWIRTFQTKLPHALDTAVAALPVEWYAGDIVALQQWLNLRIQSLPSLVEEHLERTIIFRDRIDAKVHVQNSRICEIGT